MERLTRLSGNAAAFIPQASPRISQRPDSITSDGLFVVDTQGQKLAFKQPPAPVVRSPSPTGSASSEEEVIFAGRRPQTTRVEAPAPRPA